jgi:hypothetical protein
VRAPSVFTKAHHTHVDHSEARGPWNQEPAFKYVDDPTPQGSAPQEVKNPDDEIGLIPVDWRATWYHSLVLSFGGQNGVMLAAGVIGATVMPHAILLHSSVARNRVPAADASMLRHLVRASNTDVSLTMGAVGLVNMAIMCVAAVTFSTAGLAGLGRLAAGFPILDPASN